MIPAIPDRLLVAFVLNAAWMAFAVALLNAGLERAKAHPAVRELAWTVGLLLTVALPLAAILWPVPEHPLLLTGPPGLSRIGAAIAIPSSARGILWTEYAAAVYVLIVTLSAVRLFWNWARLARLSEASIAAPMTVGIFRRRILLPERFRRSAPQVAVEAALAHEQTHLERYDFARNLALEVAMLPVAFHPAVRYMKDRLAQARELVCDDLTARASGDRRRYAEGLVEAARALAQPRAEAPGLAMGMLDHTDLEERIMLLNGPAPARSRRAYLLLGAVIALAPAMTLFGFYLQDEEPVHKMGPGVKEPRVVHREEAEYPEAQQKAKVAGTVVLTTEISKAGLAEKIVVKRSLDPALDASAVASVKKWRFEPGMIEGAPVRVAATIEINFKIK
jgi:TonB family protein